MKWIGMILLFTSVTGPALAQGINRVDEKDLKLIGRGIENRRTHDWIRLACVAEGQSCSKLRFVFFRSGSDDAFYFGETLSVTKTDSSEPTPKEIKTAIKSLYKDFSMRRHADTKIFRSVFTVTSFSIIIGTAMLPISPIIFACMWMLEGLFVVPQVEKIETGELLNNSGRFSRYATDYDDTHKMVSNHYFKKFFKFMNAEELLSPQYESDVADVLE